MFRTSLLCGVMSMGLAIGLPAADWPHWRGPDRTGVSPESDLALTWSVDENVVWKLPLPDLSGATPIVWGHRVFLNVADAGKLYLWCVDRGDGSLVWKRELDDRNEEKRKGNMSSPSPVTDGEHVWVMTGTGVLRAFDYDGNEKWSRALQEEYGVFGILHGYSSSPLLHEGSLYVQVLHGFSTDDPSYVMAIDAASGETRWRVERPTDAPREAPDAYTTPTLLSRGGVDELVVSGADYVTGHSLETGEETWRLGGLNPTGNPAQRIVASPTVVGNMIYVPTRVRPMLVLTAGASGPPEVVWTTEEGPDVPTPAITDDYIFIMRDKGAIFCHDRRTGEVLWGPERVDAAVYSASPVVADGRIYITSEAGTTTVMAAGPEFEILAENTIDEYTLSSLAVSDGQIFLRTSDNLYCIAKESDPPAGAD